MSRDSGSQKKGSPSPEAAPIDSSSQLSASEDLHGRNRPENQASLSNPDRVGVWVGIVTGILGLLTAIYGVFFWVEREIASQVEDRMKPYEHVLTGIALVEDEEPDKAVPEFEAALKQFDIAQMPESRLIAVLDQYLYAIVNSEDIDEHGPDFHRLNKNLNRIPNEGWHKLQIGWYHLRTGDLRAAEENLESSLEKYRKARQLRTSADTHWAIALLHLAEGDVSAALASTRAAESANPRDFSIDRIALDTGAMRNDPWFVRLMDQYNEEFPTAFDEWAKKLNEIRIEVLAEQLRPLLAKELQRNHPP